MSTQAVVDRRPHAVGPDAGFERGPGSMRTGIVQIEREVKMKLADAAILTECDAL